MKNVSPIVSEKPREFAIIKEVKGMIRDIEREHVEQALAKIDKEGVPPKEISKKYVLVHNGKEYPPKYVISIAHQRAKSTRLRRFSPKEAIYHLTRLGFRVIDKEKNEGVKPGQNQVGRKTRREEKLASVLAKKLEEKLKERKICREIEVVLFESLIYKVIVDENLNYDPLDPKDPKRGSNAFQVDILIRDRHGKIPLVVIELKLAKFSTYDVITYSQKALKHKDIYPYLRYGFVIMCGKSYIERRFFVHNQGMDFAYVMNCHESENNPFDPQDLQNLTDIVINQVQSACFLLDVLSDKKKPKGFSEIIQTEGKYE